MNYTNPNPEAEDPYQSAHSVEAEQQLLGTLMINNDTYQKVAGVIGVEDFYDPVHARIFTAIQSRIDNGQLASPVTLKPAFETDEGLKELGGVRYLARMAGASIAPFAVPDYASMIADLSAKRKLIDCGVDIKARISEGSEGAAQLVQDVETTAGALLSRTSVKPLTQSHLSAVTDAVMQINSAYQGEEPVGVSTGIEQLDEALGFLKPGEFLVLGGRPGMAKTTAAQNFAINAAQSGVGVFFAGLEMPSAQLATRELSMGLAQQGIKIPYSRMTKGRLSEDEMRQVVAEADKQSSLPVFKAERDVRDISKLRSAVKRTHQFMADSGCPLGLVIVDYLQLLQSVDAKSIYDRVSMASDTMKSIAIEMNLPVIALSQLSRSIEQRESKIPMLSDLRESGKLEEDADVVMFCYREAYYLQKELQGFKGDVGVQNDLAMRLHDCRDHIDFVISKQRSGPEKTVKAFVDLAHCHLKQDRSDSDTDLI